MKPFRRKTNQKGFTMTELMVVVVIVGILAAIAVPIYSRYVRNARVTEATSRVGEIVTGCKSYAMEHTGDDGHPTWPTEAQAQANDSIIDITTMTENISDIQLSGGGSDATADGNFTITVPRYVSTLPKNWSVLILPAGNSGAPRTAPSCVTANLNLSR